jgi:hypothetical protein
MPKTLKPGWIYVNKNSPIGIEYAIHKETGWVYFEDGVKYSPEEISIIIESGGRVSKSLHTVKKVFQGEIVRYEQGTHNEESTGPIAPIPLSAVQNDNTAEKQEELEIW